MIFSPIFSTKLKRKKNQRMKKKMMKMRMLLIKRKTFQMIQWQVWLIYRGVPLNKTAPYEMSHSLLFKVIYDRIWNRKKNILKLPPFWISNKELKKHISVGKRYQRLIFEHGFWNFGYGYECLGYSVFGFGFRLWKNDEFYWNSWP